jgi:myo-inositol-1-phosphate synthase
MKKLGVVIIGLNGAVSSTLIAGVALMNRGLTPRHGMLTEPNAQGPGLSQLADLAPLESMVFAGWDVDDGTLHEAALRHGVLHPSVLAPIEAELQAQTPWPAIFASEYAGNVHGANLLDAHSHRGQIETIQRDVNGFKEAHGLDEVVMLNLASTESWMPRQAVHNSLSAFEAGLDANDPAISPLMRYIYATMCMGIAHANFTPSLANVPALAELAEAHRVPYAGMDGKTGQTLVKSAIGGMFRARRLFVDGWYSTNILGNNDGLVLDDPRSNKTKVESKTNVLDAVVGHAVPNHQVHIHYYGPRGDAKEAWDNIDFTGFAGVPMQMKINFLCQDSILAAPLCVDLVRLLALARQRGAAGIQRQFSMFFKSPYHTDGEHAVHDLYQQEALLLDWCRDLPTA